MPTRNLPEDRPHKWGQQFDRNHENDPPQRIIKPPRTQTHTSFTQPKRQPAIIQIAPVEIPPRSILTLINLITIEMHLNKQ